MRSFRFSCPAIVFLGTALIALPADASVPQVTNVIAVQRAGTKLVDVTYDLYDPDGDAMTVRLLASPDGGQSFPIQCVTATGVGAGVTSGTGKHIVWNAGADYPSHQGTNYVVKVSADDGTGDGCPGICGVSDDFAQAGEATNGVGANIGYPGVDDDQNGIADDAGEGIDLRDREVHDANETAAQDAVNTHGNGISSENDRRDNDHDAFFRTTAFGRGNSDEPTTAGQSVVWWNVDESPSNGCDDDGDGAVDEADERPEGGDPSNPTRYRPAYDEYESGISGGPAVPTFIDGVNSILGSNPAFVGTIYVSLGGKGRAASGGQ